MMKILLFDKAAMGSGMDFSKLEALGEVVDVGLAKTEEETLGILLSRSDITDAAVLLCNKAPITEKVLTLLPKLQYIGVFATGYNNIDLPAAEKRGIAVCNVPGYSTEAVAQLVFAFILQSASKVSQYTTDTASGKWIGYPIFSMIRYDAQELYGKTLGILGYGNIGSRVAEIGRAFGMRVLVCRKNTAEPCPFRYVDKETLLRESDYLSLNCPLTEETAHFINEESLSKMKKGAVLINTARGGLVDEAALAKALTEGTPEAAYLDVLNTEPMSENCPLYQIPNCHITPHIAWAPEQTRKRLLETVVENIVAFFSGTPQNRVV